MVVTLTPEQIKRLKVVVLMEKKRCLSQKDTAGAASWKDILHALRHPEEDIGWQVRPQVPNAFPDDDLLD
jgi:hypothetical protein